MNIYCPTVLLVDDDPSLVRYCSNKFHSDTSIGVVTANTLARGKELLDDSEIAIDAVVADVYFEHEKDDPQHDLFDGLDLLEYSRKIRPTAVPYVLSFFAEDDANRKKAEGLNLNVAEWIQKTIASGDEQLAPWSRIERDLIGRKLSDVSDIEARLEALGRPMQAGMDPAAVVEYVRDLRVPIRTYLQDLSHEGLFLRKPIEVICTFENRELFQEHRGMARDEEGTCDSRVTASARRLGLLMDGVGATVAEAIIDLQEIIKSQLMAFRQEKDQSVVGYARLVLDRFAEYVDLGDE